MLAGDDNERMLAARAADGDGGAIEQLYDRYEKRLFNYCHRITGNREDAADATQEAFCNVIQRLPGIDVAELNFAAYLFTAARNACLDTIALRKRAIATDEVPEEAGATLPIEFDPERSALNEDQKRAARAANAQLPEKQRAVLALREVAELSYEDIAAAMEMNSNSVAQLISRARLNFFKQLRSAAVVIPPLDEAGERAIELAVARQDGHIEQDELTWLEQHLRENESSRINVEAIHESTLIYRAIGPAAVLAALRDEVVGRATGLSSQPHDTSGPDSRHGDDDHDGSADAGVGGNVGAGAPRAVSPVAAGAEEAAGTSDGRHRSLLVVATIVLALILAAAAAGGLSDDSVQRAESVAETFPTSPTTASRSASKQSSKSGGQSAITAPPTGTPYSQLQADTPKKREKSAEARAEREKAADEPAAEQPVTTEPTPETPPATPTGPTGKPPKQPAGPPILCGNNCSGPPVN